MSTQKEIDEQIVYREIHLDSGIAISTSMQKKEAEREKKEIMKSIRNGDEFITLNGECKETESIEILTLCPKKITGYFMHIDHPLILDKEVKLK